MNSSLRVQSALSVRSAGGLTQENTGSGDARPWTRCLPLAREGRAGRGARALGMALLCVSMWGCASAPSSRDPLEPMNRKVFAFNETVDEKVVAPVARTYRDIVPSPVRTGVTNFFANVSDAWSAVNSFLQLKGGQGLRTTLRVGVNTFFGLGGLLDIAGEAGLVAEPEDFGQTLGYWGVGAGPYIVWPLLGPSTLRDTAAMPLDLQATPNLFINDPATRNGLTGLRLINLRANLLDASRLFNDAASVDKYLFTRDAYLQRRRNQIYDGDPPEENDDDPEIDESPASAPGSAGG